MARALISLWTLAALLAVVLLGNFPVAPVWFGLLLAVPLTVGLPTTLGALLVVACWNGPPLWAGAVLAALCGFLLQVLAHRALTRCWGTDRTEARG